MNKQELFHCAKTQTMEHHQSRVVTILSGLVGGMSKYILVDAPTFPIRMIEAIVTAAACAFVGYWVKIGCDAIKAKFSKSK